MGAACHVRICNSGLGRASYHCSNVCRRPVRVEWHGQMVRVGDIGMQLTIPIAIAGFLPLLATGLSSWLADDKLKPGINALIALIAILLAATACELLAGNVTGDPATSFLGILGYVGVLM